MMSGETGERVQGRLDRLGITPEKAAREAGMTVDGLEKLLDGRLASVRGRRLVRLAELLALSVEHCLRIAGLQGKRSTSDIFDTSSSDEFRRPPCRSPSEMSGVFSYRPARGPRYGPSLPPALQDLPADFTRQSWGALTSLRNAAAVTGATLAKCTLYLEDPALLPA